MLFIFYKVIRASVPRLELDSVFEQKNDIAKAVEQELEKVMNPIDNIRIQLLHSFQVC